MVAVIPSAMGTSRAAPPPRRQRQEPSALRQVPTQILPDGWSTDLRVGAPYRCKGRTAPEHERRPSSARRLGRSSRAHGTTTTLAAGGDTGSQAGEPDTLKLTTPAVGQPRVIEVRPPAGLVSALSLEC
jgi:hypothetical protein